MKKIKEIKNNIKKAMCKLCILQIQNNLIIYGFFSTVAKMETVQIL